MKLPAGQLSHFPKPPRVVAKARPAYVSADFGGACQVFPAPDEKGKCPFFLGYQSDWILDASRLKLMEKARQIGLSWSTAYRLVRETSLKTAQLDAWVSSRDEIQAGLFLQDCKNFSAILNRAAEDLGEQIFRDEDGKVMGTARVLRFANQRAINSMSSNPNAQAGKRGSRALDEYALHQDPRKLYAIAYPGITWGGNMEIISTHRGSANHFNELVNEIREKGNPKQFSLHRITLQTALEHGFLYKLQSKLPAGDDRQQMDEAAYFDFIRAGCVDEESFLQEYMCVPGDDSTAFLSYDMISSCRYRLPEENAQWCIYRISYPKRGSEQPPTEKKLGTWRMDDAKGPLFIGWDIGRQKDLTVLTVAELLGDVLHIRLLVEMERTPFSRQEAELYPLLTHPLFRRACGDQSGIGRQFCERSQEKFGSYRVEGYDFTPQVKDQLAAPMRPAFEDRTIRLPDDAILTSDLRGIVKETLGDNIRYAGERGKNGHCDRFWSIALAKHAAKTPAGAGYSVTVI